MSTEQHQQSASEHNPTAATVGAQVQEALTRLQEVRDLLSQGHWPVGTLETAQLVLQIQGTVPVLSMKNSAGQWRSIVRPGTAVGAMPGSEDIPGAPLTAISSEWHASAEEALAQALRRYCDLFASPEAKK